MKTLQQTLYLMMQGRKRNFSSTFLGSVAAVLGLKIKLTKDRVTGEKPTHFTYVNIFYVHGDIRKEVKIQKHGWTQRLNKG